MISVVRFKDGVRVDPMTPTLARLIGSIDAAARVVEFDLTVTCGREGHPDGDPHTEGRAIDVRARDLSPEQVLRVYSYLKTILGDLFYVQYETFAAPVNGGLRNIAVVNPQASAPHFHLQSKRGTIYPPQDAPIDGLKA